MLLTLGFFLAALLYASVGHGGASGYLAIMALVGMAPAEMKPVALVLNVVVSVIGVSAYARTGQHHWRTLWPFLLGAAPFAFLGGGLPVPPHAFKVLVGVLLGLGALRLLVAPKQGAEPPRPPPVWAGLTIGAAIGLLAGLTGTGGGIFLTPVLLFAGWAGAPPPRPCSSWPTPSPACSAPAARFPRCRRTSRCGPSPWRWAVGWGPGWAAGACHCSRSVASSRSCSRSR